MTRWLRSSVLVLASVDGLSCLNPQGWCDSTPGTHVVSTLAGNGTFGFLDGPGTAAEFISPTGIAVDSRGNAYVVDTGNNRVRKIDPSGDVTTVAGNGFGGGTDNPAAQMGGFADGTGGVAGTAEFFEPHGIAVDSTGVLYVADTGNNRIRRIDSAGNVTTLAEIASPMGIAVDSAGNVYTTAQNLVARIDPAGNAAVFAGSDLSGFVDGTGGPQGTALFNSPQGLAVDLKGNVFVADSGNNRIRKIDPAGKVTTLAGNGSNNSSYSTLIADGTGGPHGTAQFQLPSAVAVDSGENVYVADSYIGTIRRIDPAGNVTTLAGNANSSFDFTNGAGGCAGPATFSGPRGVAVDGAGRVLVADTNNSVVRTISP